VDESIYIVDLFRSISEATATKTGMTINYMHGHPLEITETLTQLTLDPTAAAGKYPLIALFQDFEEVKNGLNFEVSLNLIIATLTDNNYLADERYTLNFKPTLYPIYNEFLLRIAKSTFFFESSVGNIKHTKIDRLYWGRNGLFGNEGNIFNDYIDCIEIQNLKLKVKQNKC